MKNQLVNQILSLLSEQVYEFEGSQHPLPIKTTFLADSDININTVAYYFYC